MSPVSLPLDKVQLSCSKENLRLSITPTLELECDVGLLDHLESSEILQALRSGCIWVCRGVGCEVSIIVTLSDTISFGSLSHEQVIEEFGTSIRNADFWDQLSLSPSLEIPSYEVGKISSEIRIAISHFQPSIDLMKSATSLSTIAADTRPPDGVASAGLKRLSLDLEIRPIRNSSRKRQRTSRLSDPEENMLLDDIGFLDEYHSRLPEGSQPQIASTLPFVNTQSSPSLEKKVLGRSYRESLSDIEENDMEDEDLLLLDTDSQLLTPPSSDPRNLPPTRKRRAYRKKTSEPLNKDQPLELDLPSALKLIDAGLRTLIGGRQIKVTPGVRLLKPDPTHTLSELAPALWSPGYLKAVSRRSRFLPILSGTLSSSLLKHAQSPSLKKSLSDLANLNVSSFQALKNQVSSDSGRQFNSHSHKVAKVVQARIWKMTQSSVFDPLAARRLRMLEGNAQRRDGAGILFADENRHVELATFSNLADELAEWMEEEHFEDFLEEEEDLTVSENLYQDYTANSEKGGGNRSEDWRDSGSVGFTASFGEFGAEDESLEIPPEFWEDLRLEEENDGLLSEELLIPDEFWEDLRVEEEEENRSENSNMLI